METDLQIKFIGHNENGFVGFIIGTNELLYLERPRNWEDYVSKYKLPYITHKSVCDVNMKLFREEQKDGEKKRSKRRSKKKAVSDKGICSDDESE